MATERKSIKGLIAEIQDDAKGLVQDQIDLLKAEGKSLGAKAGGGAGALVGALVFLGYGFLLLLFAAVYGLVAGGLPEWAGFLIIGGILVVIAIIVALIGVSLLKKASAGPRRSIRSLERTKQTFSASVPAGGASDKPLYKKERL